MMNECPVRSFFSVQKVGLAESAAFYFDRLPFFKDTGIFHFIIYGSGNLNAVGKRCGLHARREVYGHAPHVIDKFLETDDACNNRTCMDSDTYLQTGLVFFIKLAYSFKHIDSKVADSDAVVIIPVRETGCAHV